ncbi:MAG: hypothetical protein AAGM04_00940 [Pseudomonadota bacterium]
MKLKKMLNKIAVVMSVLCATVFGALLYSSDAHAKLNCKAIDGKWSGRMSGSYSGKTTMTVRNCRVTWTLPDRRKNYCRYRERSGAVNYSCSLGSRGSVAINGSRIVMKNIYTAHRSGAYTVRFSKLR